MALPALQAPMALRMEMPACYYSYPYEAPQYSTHALQVPIGLINELLDESAEVPGPSNRTIENNTFSCLLCLASWEIADGRIHD